MIHEIPQENVLQKTKRFVNELGPRTIGAYAIMGALLIAISITFYLSQTNQDIRQDASNHKGEKAESYLSKLRRQRLTPTLSPSPTPTVQATLTPSPSVQATLTPTPTIQTTISPTYTPVGNPKPGDTNDDNIINIQDLSFVLSNWNKNDVPRADFNMNGTVEISDLSLLLSNWGK